jgi:hypothetical protein
MLVLPQGGTNIKSWGDVAAEGYWTQSDSYLYPKDTTWKVGIGTTSPSGKLDIRGAFGNNNPWANALYVYNPNNVTDQDAIITARVGGSAAADPFISLDIYGEYGWTIGIDNTDGNKFKIDRGWADVGENTDLVIDTSGNVGIGTPSPARLLHLGGVGNEATGGPVIKLGTDTSGRNFEIVGNTAGPVLGFKLDNAATGDYLMMIKSTGNVGIGTTAIGTERVLINATGGTGTGIKIIGNDAERMKIIGRAGDNVSIVRFYDNTETNQVYLQSNGTSLGIMNGNVGIGVTGPIVPLEVVKDQGVAAGQHNLFYFGRFDAAIGGAANAGLTFSYEADGTNVNFVRMRTLGNQRDLRIATYDGGISDKVTITGTGNVGIGTMGPEQTGTGYSYSNTKLLRVDDSSLPVRVSFTSGANVGLNLIDYGASADLKWMQIFTNDGKTSFNAYKDDGSAQATNILVLNHSTGNVGIGTATPDNIKLDVQDDIEVGTGTTGCVRDEDNTVIAGTCVSDIRLKKDVKPLGSVLDRVAALEPVTFKWLDGNATEYGLIGQQVIEVMPELVAEDEEGYLRVSYDSKLFMVLLQAVKELKAENDALRQRIAALEEVL